MKMKGCFFRITFFVEPKDNKGAGKTLRWKLNSFCRKKVSARAKHFGNDAYDRTRRKRCQPIPLNSVSKASFRSRSDTFEQTGWNSSSDVSSFDQRIIYPTEKRFCWKLNSVCRKQYKWGRKTFRK